MDETAALLERLERIEALERAGAQPRALLEELRALLGEAEAWAQLEGDARAWSAIARCDSALGSEMVAM